VPGGVGIGTTEFGKSNIRDFVFCLLGKLSSQAEPLPTLYSYAGQTPKCSGLPDKAIGLNATG